MTEPLIREPFIREMRDLVSKLESQAGREQMACMKILDFSSERYIRLSERLTILGAVAYALNSDTGPLKHLLHVSEK